MKLLSHRTLKILTSAGWSASRDEQSIEDSFRDGLGSDWLSSGSSFVRKFGGLDVGNRLFTWSKPASQHMLLDLKHRIEQTINLKVVAVATANYGDGSALWIDACGRFYIADGEGMFFVGNDEATMFEVVVFGEKPPDPPQELREAMAEAYDWSVQD